MKITREPHEHHVSALVHFGVGALLTAIAALVAYSLHHVSLLHDLQMLNLDVLFLSQPTPSERDRLVIVDVTEDDYRNRKLFGSESPLKPALVQKLIAGAAGSGARVIGVDLDTSGWTLEERTAVSKAVSEEVRDSLRAGTRAARVVWAVGAWPVPNGSGMESAALTGLQDGDCEALPASLPDEFGVVRGYVTALKVEREGKEIALPGMASLLDALDRDPAASCAPPAVVANAVEPEKAEEAQRLVNYSGRGGDFVHISSATLLGVVNSEAWRNSNPLQGQIVLVGGSYSEARDKYVTPAGYRDGVEILARSVVSSKRGISAAGQSTFVLLDILLGGLLLTATWFLRNTWSLILAFVLLPAVTVALSFAIFHAYGFFASFVPVVAGVLIHRTCEHLYEHWQLVKEVHHLREKVRSGASHHAG